MTNTELLISYTDVLLIPENSALPFSMPESTEIVKYDGKVPDFVSKLYQYIPGKRVMIETDSQLICNVAVSIIETMETNIAFIRFGGEFIADKALEEIKKLENILVCEDGSQIILSAPMANGVFSTENNRIAVNGNDISGGTYQSLRKKRDWRKNHTSHSIEYSAIIPWRCPYHLPQHSVTLFHRIFSSQAHRAPVMYY